MTQTGIDKAYVKKHKLNEMLNELFKLLTENKPDNPLEFAFKHFESKLPKPKIELDINSSNPSENFFKNLLSNKNSDALNNSNRSQNELMPLTSLKFMVYFKLNSLYFKSRVQLYF